MSRRTESVVKKYFGNQVGIKIVTLLSARYKKYKKRIIHAHILATQLILKS